VSGAWRFLFFVCFFNRHHRLFRIQRPITVDPNPTGDQTLGDVGFEPVVI
jgi:hypothetical protein